MADKKLEDYLYYEEKNPDLKIYHGDCLEIMPLIGGGIDLIVTDPPYGEQTHKNAQTQSNGRSKKLITFQSTTPEKLVEIMDFFCPNRWAVFTCDWQHALPLKQQLKNMEFVRLGAWVKPDGCPQFTGDRPATGWEAVMILHNRKNKKRWNGGGYPAVWNMHVWRGNEHPTQKPVDLFKTWIKDFSDQYETTLDPFLGSGTTLVACKELNRNGIGIEISEKYCEIAKKRIQNTVRSLFQDTTKPQEQKEMFS